MKVAVLGAGIAGLTAAWQLDQQGHDVTVLEASDRIGGKIKTDQVDGYILESGPHAIMPSYKSLLSAIPQLGLSDSYVEAGENGKNRFICMDGKPYPLPTGLISAIRTPLLSFGAKLRVLREPFIKPRYEDESVASFFSRRMGPEIVTRLIDPFISGVYAGDPDNLSVASAFPVFKGFERDSGSLIRGAIKKMRTAKKNGDPNAPREKRRRSLYSFKTGLIEIPAAMAGKLGDSLKLGTPAKELKANGSGWTVNGESYDAVVCALPVHTWRALNGHHFPQTSIRYTSVTAVHLAYPKDTVKARTDGFGMLIPSVEKRKILGVLYDSSLFPGRAPEDQQLFTIFMGGARNTWTVDTPVEELIRIAHREVTELMRIEGITAPLFSRGHRWSHAIPQYDFNHLAAVEQIKQFEQSQHNIAFAGNYDKGISVGHAFESGMAAAERLIAGNES